MASATGISYIDTAASYGDAELRIGPWMGQHRAEFFLATKTDKRSYDVAWEQIRLSLERLNVDYVDLLGGLVKSLIFGLLVSSIGCLRGFQTGKGPGAVGVSTTRSLVTAVAMIVAADGVIGAVYYSLGV